MYQKTIRQIQQYRKEFINGKMNDIIKLKGRERRNAMRSKSIKVGARGWKVTAEADRVGVELLKFLEVLSNTER